MLNAYETRRRYRVLVYLLALLLGLPPGWMTRTHAATKRGSHLALSLERLDALLPRPAQRIGLSATVRPLDEVARYLGGPHHVAHFSPQLLVGGPHL